MIRIGCGKADITPPVGLSLSGFAMRQNRPSVAIDDPLAVKALVIESGEPYLLLSYDLLGFDFELDERIRAVVRGVFGERVLITTTHTHSGPPTMPIAGETRVPESYIEKLCQATQFAAAQALEKLSPAELFHVETELGGVNLNRRAARAPGGEGGRFPLDRSLDLFVFKTPGVGRRSGECLAGVVRFACHAVTMTTQHVSADFPGELTRRLEAQLGAPCLFLQGTAGDTNPTVVSQDHATMLGFVDRMTAQLKDLPTRLSPVSAEPVRLKERAFTLPFAPFPPPEALRAAIARNERIQAGDLSSADLQAMVAEYAAWCYPEEADIPGTVKHWAQVYKETAQRTLRARSAGNAAPKGVPFHAAALRLGPFTLLFLTGEILTPVGQHIQALAPGQQLRVISYLSPIVGYIADREDYRLGGYEATNAWMWYRHPGPLREDSEAVILEQVKGLME